MQAELNVGLFGHVDHGKTTLTKAMTGKWTDTHSEEIKRGISIRLGYADAQIYYCSKCKKHSFEKKCSCGAKTEGKRKISFIDAPGHETLMTTAISASAIIDCALFLISANEECPQPQTKEHFMVLESLGIDKIIIVQTKIDLVSKEKALENHKQIKEFIGQTSFKDKEIPIIPICAFHKLNIGAVADLIEEKWPTPKRDKNAPLRIYVSRSFDINKPGTEIKKLIGGIIGGSIVQGTLKDEEEVILSPGITKKEGKTKQITFKVNGLRAENESLKEAHPGGLIAIGTHLDPALTKSDGMTGSIIGAKDNPTKTLNELQVKYKMFKRDDVQHVSLREGEPIVLNIHTATTVGVITKLKKGTATVVLKKPVAADSGLKAAISKRVGQRWRLVALGEIV